MLASRLTKQPKRATTREAILKKNPLRGFDDALFCSSNAADGGSAVGALTLGDGLTVLGNALNGILHFLLSLALHAVSLDSHK